MTRSCKTNSIQFLRSLDLIGIFTVADLHTVMKLLDGKILYLNFQILFKHDSNRIFRSIPSQSSIILSSSLRICSRKDSLVKPSFLPLTDFSQAPLARLQGDKNEVYLLPTHFSEIWSISLTPTSVLI